MKFTVKLRLKRGADYREFSFYPPLFSFYWKDTTGTLFHLKNRFRLNRHVAGKHAQPDGGACRGSDLLAKQVDQQLCSAVGHLGLIVELRHGGHKTGDLYRAFYPVQIPYFTLENGQNIEM